MRRLETKKTERPYGRSTPTLNVTHLEKYVNGRRSVDV
jgi:hypothetical protein